MPESVGLWSTFRGLLQYVKPYRLMLVFSFLLALLSSGTEAAFALLIKPLVDQGLVERDTHMLTWIPLLLSLMIIGRGICYFFSQYLVSNVARSVVLDLRKKLFEHTINLDYQHHKKLKSGEITSTMIYTVEQLASTVSSCFLTIVGEGCLVIALLASMFYINWKLSCILILSTPVIALFVQLTSRRIRHVSENTLNNMQSITHHISQVFLGQKIIKVHHSQQYEIKRFNQLLKNNRAFELKGVSANAFGSLLVQLAIVLPFSAALLMLAHSPDITVGSFVSVVIALLRVLQPLKRLSSVNAEIQKGLVAAQRIFDTLQIPKEHQNETGPQASIADLTLQDVSFSYEGKPVVKSLNLTIPVGHSIGLIGQSGSGKSTIISLLLRLLSPTNGTIQLGDQPANHYSLESYRSLFSYVTQDTILFSGSILENIAYGETDIDIDRVKLVADAACADEFIQALPDQYQTNIIDGSELSGGQKQRIAIARALYRTGPSIIILDEATSNLDIETERKVIQRLNNPEFCNQTKIIIAHRLKAVQACNAIYVIENGTLVENDSHENLLKDSNSNYAKLYQLQYSNEILST